MLFLSARKINAHLLIIFSIFSSLSLFSLCLRLLNAMLWILFHLSLVNTKIYWSKNITLWHLQTTKLRVDDNGMNAIYFIFSKGSKYWIYTDRAHKTRTSIEYSKRFIHILKQKQNHSVHLNGTLLCLLVCMQWNKMQNLMHSELRCENQKKKLNTLHKYNIYILKYNLRMRGGGDLIRNFIFHVCVKCFV